MAADGGPRRGARGLLLVLAAAAALGAVFVARVDGLPAPWLERWSHEHPDPRALSPDEAATLARTLDGQRRDDALLLLAGLAAGCAAVAAFPELARAAGSTLTRVLVVGSVALGLSAVVASVRGQLDGARDGTWTLGDDSLPAIAGPQTAALRAARDRTAPGDTVLIVGTNQPLFNAAAWTFDGRALYPILQDVPDGMSTEALRDFTRGLPQGAGGARRWLLDLRALERGEAAGRPALLELTP